MQKYNFIIKENEIIGALNRGEVGAGKLYLFPQSPEHLQPKLLLVPLPTGAKTADEVGFYTVVGDSLESPDPLLSIENGSKLVTRAACNPIEASTHLCIIRLFRSELCVKWFGRLFDGKIELLSNNPDYPPEVFDQADIEVLEIVTDVIRKAPTRSLKH